MNSLTGLAPDDDGSHRSPRRRRRRKSPSPLRGGVGGRGNLDRRRSEILPSLSLAHVVLKAPLRHDGGGNAYVEAQILTAADRRQSQLPRQRLEPLPPGKIRPLPPQHRDIG